MTVNAIEKALWTACSNPAEAERFGRDPDSFLRDFRMDDEERSRVTSWDVRELADRGVSPMLLMMAFGAVRGVQNMGEYVQKINRLGQDVPAG